MSQSEDNVRAEFRTSKNQPRQQQYPPAGSGDIVSTWCNMWSNLFTSLGESISSANCAVPAANEPPNQARNSTQQTNPANCGLNDLSVRWCGSGTSNRAQGKPDDTTQVSGKYQDQSTQAKVDFSTGSNN